jgi:citrate synthase
MTMLSADEAARRLGIKVESLYAYVSRGLVERHHGSDGRASTFDATAIDALARRGRPRLSSRQSSMNMLIETRLTSISSHRILFRGHDAVSLAATTTFEQVAELLWTGVLTTRTAPWTGSIVALPTTARLTDSLAIIVALAAAADPYRADLQPAAVATTGRHLIATIVDSLQLRRSPASTQSVPRLVLGDVIVRRSIAARLSMALSPRRPKPGMVEVVNAALVLLADHELATSALAARVAASARSDPYSVVLAGLGAVNGPLHGGASVVVHGLLQQAADDGPTAAIAAALRSSGRVPGFGHPLYPEGDPRATALLRALRSALPGNRAVASADHLVAVLRQRTDVQPNVDFSLAVLAHAAGMDANAGEAVFAVARIAGWLAHAIEEYGEAPLRFRPRASYIGP